MVDDTKILMDIVDSKGKWWYKATTYQEQLTTFHL